MQEKERTIQLYNDAPQPRSGKFPRYREGEEEEEANALN